MKKRKELLSQHMRAGALISGGKDSLLALHRAKATGHEVVCLISIVSKNRDSYMFHSPNTHMIKEIAKALNLPLIEVESEGKKEEELKDLETAIKKAKEKYMIEGVISGAVKSTYQATRLQKMLDKLDLWSLNPLWQNDELKLLEEMIKNNFEIYVVRVAAYPLSEEWLGRRITDKELKELKEMNKKYGMSIIGEGGEYESFVSSAPYFSKRIVIEEWKKRYNKASYEGTAIIKKYTIQEKEIHEHIISPISITTSKNEAHKKEVLIIKTNALDIHDYEFVEPVAKIIKETLNLPPHLLHIDELHSLSTNQLEKYNKIIITGTALKDFSYLSSLPKIKEKIEWLAREKDILGICAGAQLLYLTLIPNTQLKRIKRIGMYYILQKHKEKNQKNNNHTYDKTKAYFLHKFAFSSPPSSPWECKYVMNKICVGVTKKDNQKSNNKVLGVLFHPEVGRKDIIEKFLREDFQWHKINIHKSE